MDCQTYSGWGYPSYQTLPNSVRQVTSGWRLSSCHCATLPLSSSVTIASAFGAIATLRSDAPSPARNDSKVCPEVP